MLAHVRAAVYSFLNPPVFEGGVPTTTRNTYIVSSAMVAIVLPLLILFQLVVPQLTRLIVPSGTILLFISLTTILLIRAGRFTAQVLPTLTILGWAALTWTAWETGGLYSPALYAQFVLVVLAEMCNGWRWGMAATSMATATIIAFGWADVAGVSSPSQITIAPALFAAIVATFLVALAGLEALLVHEMRDMQAHLADELTVRRAADQRLQNVVDHAPFGAFVCEMRDFELLITHVNHSASLVLGIDASLFLGRRVADAFPLADRDLARQFTRVATTGGMADTGAMPFFSGGTRRTLDVHAFQVGPGSMAAFFTDVTEKRVEEAQINRMAFTDELTELPNRSLLHSRLSTTLAQARSGSGCVALLFIDLDEFKPINDKYGHHFGDLLLIEVAHRLQNCARESDTVARMGGDEFTMIVADVHSRDEAEAVARRAVEVLREPFVIRGEIIRVTASVGVAMTTDDDTGLDSLLEHSDMAMYRAKQAGRNGYCLYDSSAA
jgi:diguanylate cyclase (GGDEF)-like protein